MTGRKDKLVAVIVWYPSQDRARGWAEALNAPIHYVYRAFFRPRILAPFRYLLQAYDTWKIFMRDRPRVVHVTNPPVIAPLVVRFCCFLTGAKYVMDTHSPALYSRLWGWTLPLQRIMARPALVNMLDQERFKTMFESWGARALVLERSPERTSIPAVLPSPPSSSIDITVINTFSYDEPLEPVLRAAEKLPRARFFITGHTRMIPPAVLDRKPSNVTFTGYLRGADYWNRLAASHAVMCLTTYEYSLLAGGQDGMILGVPLILSRQPVLTEYFTSGTVFVDNTADGIRDAVLEVERRGPELRRELVLLLAEKRRLWNARFQGLRSLIEEAKCR